MDIKAGVQTAIFLTIVGVALSIWLGIQSIRMGRKIPYYRLKQERVSQGWQLLILALFLILATYWLTQYGEPVAYTFYPPSVTPSPTPSITPTPTISPIPSITLTPTISNTPSVSDTPTASSTPFMPAEVATQFTSQRTPNPDALFSQLVFARSLDLNTYEPVEAGTVFENPIKRLVAIYSYDNMIPGTQWTALWYRGTTLIHYETSPWDGTTGGYGFTEWAPDPSAWLPGDYQVQIFVGLDWKAVGRFTVEGKPPPPQPTLRPSATITDTASPFMSPTISLTPSIVPTLTPAPSKTPLPSSTLKPTSTPRPTDTPWPSATAKPTKTATLSPTPRPTNTARPK